MYQYLVNGKNEPDRKKQDDVSAHNKWIGIQSFYDQHIDKQERYSFPLHYGKFLAKINQQKCNAFVPQNGNIIAPLRRGVY